MMAGKNRIVPVVSISQDHLAYQLSQEDINKYTLERLEFASAYRPDIANLPEHWNGSSAEEVPGPTSELLGKWAREK